jgi:hypothetical protein
MVIFITSKDAFHEMKGTIATLQHTVWCAAEVLTLEQTNELYKAGIELSVLDYEVDPTKESELEDALETIRVHHPDEEICLGRNKKV